MAQSVLIGSGDITRDELLRIRTPPPTRSWYPVPHHAFMDRVQANLEGAGFQITQTRMNVSNEGKRLFATLDLQNRVSENVVLCVGLRNSHDKTFPLGFAAGERVLVCSNLSFGAELLISKRHSRFGAQHFNEAIASAIQKLKEYQEATAERFTFYRNRLLSPTEADACLLRSFKSGVLNTRTLPIAIDEWENPSHEEFRPRTAWSLFNAFTAALRETNEANPATAAYRTIRLRNILEGNANESAIQCNAEPQ